MGEADQRWLAGGGETGALARSVDWSKTPLGPIGSWPASLKTIVGTILHSRHPMFLWWGPELIQFYNDAYVPSFGVGKHPVAFGQRGRDCWGEVWPIIGPQIEGVMRDGHATWHDDQLVCVWRNERLEEVYWTYGYSPVFDEAGEVGGTLVVCTETTGRVVAERRLRALRTFARATASATTADAVLSAAARLFDETASDAPFALLYLTDPTSGELALSRSFGLGDAQRDAVDSACRADLAALARGQPVDLDPERKLLLPGGRWPEPSTSVVVASLAGAPAGHAPGYVVCGLSPRLSFDPEYRDHIVQLAEHIGLPLVRIETYRARDATARERDTLLLDLQTASRAKDEFLAMLGHELRNPLSPIVTALHLMKRQGDGHPSREHEIIERQVTHLVRLVDDLLDVSKITSGKIALKREPVEVGDVVAKAVEMASDLFEQRRHRLAIDVPSAGLRVDGDAVRLAQVVANLLTNAARYTPPGGLVTVRAARDGADAVLVVTDDGVGIEADMLPRIFDLFVQGQQSTDRKEGGLGLGLSLVKSLVAMHGGTVVARSGGLGKGTEFEIRLPATSKTKSARERATPTERAGGSRRVLVVDDNLDSAEMLSEMLGATGHEVAMAHDGGSALAVAEAFAPEIALLDIGLPVMDGYEVGRRLRDAPATAACRLIALTGYGQDKDQARSRESGFEAHLVKPVDLDRLLKLIGEPRRP